MKVQDDRTPEEFITHTVVCVMTDRFMSGWGTAEGGASYAGWACEPRHRARVERWVRTRGDALRVRIVGPGYRPRGRGHCHIYVVANGHPALD